MNIELIKKYANLVAKKREAEARVTRWQKELDLIETQVLDEFVSNGIDTLPVTLENGRAMTVYVQRVLYAKPKDGTERAEVVAALKRARLPELISYNASTLSAWVRERLGVEKKPLPAALGAVLDVDERVSVLAQLTSRKETKSAAAKRTLATPSGQKP